MFTRLKEATLLLVFAVALIPVMLWALLSAPDEEPLFPVEPETTNW